MTSRIIGPNTTYSLMSCAKVAITIDTPDVTTMTMGTKKNMAK